MQLWIIANTCLLLLQHLGVLFSNALAQAADNFGIGDQPARKGVKHGGTALRERGVDVPAAAAAPSGKPLAGVVIFVSQKLAGKQGAYGEGDGGVVKGHSGKALSSLCACNQKGDKCLLYTPAPLVALTFHLLPLCS